MKQPRDLSKLPNFQNIYKGAERYGYSESDEMVDKSDRWFTLFIQNQKEKQLSPEKFKEFMELSNELAWEDLGEDEYSEGGLIAPNGKPSNLTPEQYKLVRTPEFKAWFGDWENNPEGASKVIDENGEPLVVYHGTNEEFWKFNKSKGKGNIKQKSINFSSDKKVAENYGTRIIQCFLNLKKPLIKDYKGENYHTIVFYARFERRIDDIPDYIVNNAQSEKIYDGVIFLNIQDSKSAYDKLSVPIANNYYAFNNNQIKLADGTNKTFDSKNPDIRFDSGGDVEDDYYDEDDIFWTNEYLTHYLFSKMDELNHLEQKNLILSKDEKITFQESNNKGRTGMKPLGLWYAKGFEWVYWVQLNMPQWSSKYQYLHEIKTTDKVLKIKNEKDAIDFSREYGIYKDTSFFSEYTDVEEIDWDRVSKKWSGIEMVNPRANFEYLTDRRLIWTGSWDVASGCIWKADGFNEINLLIDYKEYNNPKISFDEGGEADKMDYKAQEYIDMLDALNYHPNNPKKERLKKYADILLNKYGIKYEPESVRYAKENEVLDKYVGERYITTDKGLELVLDIYKRNIERTLGIDAYNNGNYVGGLGFSIDLRKGQLRVGGASVKEEYQRKGVYRAMIDFLVKIANDNNLKFYRYGRSDMAQAFWKNYDPKENLQFAGGGSAETNIVIRKIDDKDIPEIRRNIADVLHKTGMNTNEIWSIIGDIDKNISIVAEYNNELAGFYIFREENIPIIDVVDSRFENKDGVEGVVLGVFDKFKNKGVGKKLIEYSQNNLDYDYIWGYQLKSLDNINDWLKRRDIYWESPNLYITYQMFVNGGSTETKYQFRDIGGGIVYYKKENGGLWQFIEKDEFDANANENNIEIYKEMNNSELQKGIKVEMEHKDTILKIMSGKYSVEQCAEMIAKDHLKENDKYYTHLAKMESKFDDGGYVIDEDIVSNNIQNPVVGMAVMNKNAGQFDSVKYVLDVFDDGVRVGDDGSNSGIGIADFRRQYRPATQEEVNRSKQMSKSLFELIFKNGGEMESFKQMEAEQEQDMINLLKSMGIQEPENADTYEYKTGGQTPAQQEKIAKVMGEFKRGELNTSYGTKVTDEKQAIAIALSEAGVEKKEEGGLTDLQNKINYKSPFPDLTKKERDIIMKNYTSVFEQGGVIEGQLHTECNDESGCGEKFDVGGVGNIIEAERDEAVIVSRAFQDRNKYKITGTPSQIASALNVMGGGINFDSGAIIDLNGRKLHTDKIKKETNDTDVKDDIESGSVIINRRSMYDDTVYEVYGTPKQIASAINSVNGYGVVIENGATIKEARLGV